MSKDTDRIDPLEEELKSFIEKLNSENEALSKILSGMIRVRDPDTKEVKEDLDPKKEKNQ